MSLDISHIFGFVKGEHELPPIRLKREQFSVLSLPGGQIVKSLDGNHLIHDDIRWDDAHKDTFVCLEQCVFVFGKLSLFFRDHFTSEVLLRASHGRFRRIFTDKANKVEELETFVPLTVILGVLLSQLHRIDIPTRLRLFAFLNNSMARVLESYPSLGKPLNVLSNDDSAGIVPSRFAELGVTAEEFEMCQQAKYQDCYQTMRGLIPPNISKTTLKTMIAQGIPRAIAERIWSKKVLWLICMHPEDLPKIHIGDLRGRFQFHGLDIVEMRALWYCIPKWTGDNAKADWRRDFKSKLDSLAATEISGSILPEDLRNPVYEGWDDLVVFDCNEPLLTLAQLNDKYAKEEEEARLQQHSLTESFSFSADIEDDKSMEYLVEAVRSRTNSISENDRHGGSVPAQQHPDKIMNSLLASSDEEEEEKARVGARPNLSVRISSDSILDESRFGGPNDDESDSNDDSRNPVPHFATPSLRIRAHLNALTTVEVNHDSEDVPVPVFSTRQKPQKRLNYGAPSTTKKSSFPHSPFSNALHDFKNDSFTFGSEPQSVVIAPDSVEKVPLDLQSLQFSPNDGEFQSPKKGLLVGEGSEGGTEVDMLDETYIDELSVGDISEGSLRLHNCLEPFVFPQVNNLADEFETYFGDKTGPAEEGTSHHPHLYSDSFGSKYERGRDTFSVFAIPRPAREVIEDSESDLSDRDDEGGAGVDKHSTRKLEVPLLPFASVWSALTKNVSPAEPSEDGSSYDEYDPDEDEYLTDYEEDFRDQESVLDSVEDECPVDDMSVFSDVPVISPRVANFGAVSAQSQTPWKEFWSNFRARKSSTRHCDEEEEERMIESEIDNFIVPDELTPSGHSQKKKNPSVEPPSPPDSAIVALPRSERAGRIGFLRRTFSDMDSAVSQHQRENPEHYGKVPLSKQVLNALESVDDNENDAPRNAKVAGTNLIDDLNWNDSDSEGGVSANSSESMGLKANYLEYDKVKGLISTFRPFSQLNGINSADENYFLVPISPSHSVPLPHVDSKRLHSQDSLEERDEHVDISIADDTSVVLSDAEEWDIEQLALFGDSRKLRRLIENKQAFVSPTEATRLLLKCIQSMDSVKEPLELMMLLVDTLGADVNARDEEGIAPLHSLFNEPVLGRYIVSRGGDIMSTDPNGDTVLQLCLEYGYDWILPAFEATGREKILLEDEEQANKYAEILLAYGGCGVKVKELIEEGYVSISADTALDILDKCRGNFDSMKDPVETFELLESIILQN